jgi:hypothetical protein
LPFESVVIVVPVVTVLIVDVVVAVTVIVASVPVGLVPFCREEAVVVLVFTTPELVD